MFISKKTSLFSTQSKTSVTSNSFVKAALKTSAITTSENGAVKYSTTGNPLVDQFSMLGSYKKPRNFDEISRDQELLWAFNKKASILFIFYLRIITRIVTLWNGLKTTTAAKGGELKHEPIMRMIWLHLKDSTIFWNNIQLFIAIGSWKDIITMLQYDLIYNGWENRKLDWNKFGSLILNGLNESNQRQLLLKYIPQIKSNSKCTTVESQADNLISKWICSLLFGSKESSNNYKQYRKLKTSGTAHQWQQLISQRKYEQIDFNKIHGRALNLLVKSKFLIKSGLSDKYTEWITKPDTIAKYTGFVHELFSSFNNGLNILRYDKNLIETTNKQFMTLTEKAKENKQTSLIVVRDTSGSMGSIAAGTKMSCFNIAKALALYFSYFLKGRFADNYIEFASTATMRTWTGNSPVEKWCNDNRGYIGSTNFQSVIDLFCILKQQKVDENEFPTGILCISDTEFNPVQLSQTNVSEALQKLSKYFSKEYVDNFVIVLWNLQRRDGGNKFETYGNVKNVFYFSGYSASTISFLTSKIKNAEELVEEALNQEVLKLINV